MTVLIVEDDADQLAIRSMLFRQYGFKVLEAERCHTALAAAEVARPDCAVLDLRLPDQQDGLRLICDLKRVLPNLLIYVITGSRLQVFTGFPELALTEAIFSKGTSIVPLLERLMDLRATRQDV